MPQSRDEKLRAMLAVARAFYRRGYWIQYDQSSMDPLHKSVGRRDCWAAPEDATAQKRVHLDCSSYVFAVIYQTFGYAMKGRFTREMHDSDGMCVWSREPRGDESEEERAAVLAEFERTLEPGDVVVYTMARGGHTIIYFGDGVFYHCTPLSRTESYHYPARFDSEWRDGGITRDDISIWTKRTSDAGMCRRYLFQRGCKKFSILRPLDFVGDALPDAVLRASDERFDRIVASVLTSHPEGHAASRGDVVTYTLEVGCVAGDPVEIEASFDAPDGTELIGSRELSGVAVRGAKFAASWAIRAAEASGVIAPPTIRVNGLTVAAPPVLVGGSISEEDASRLAAAVDRTMTDDDGLSAVRSVLSVDLPREMARARDAIDDLFEHREAWNAPGLFRRRGSWAEAIAVMPLHGGYAVTRDGGFTREDRHERVRMLHVGLFEPGDVVVCADDLALDRAFACVFAGDGRFYGKFEHVGAVCVKEGTDAETWVESLFGRVVFAVLRPSLARR